MKDTEFAFAVAKIRANENKLLQKSVVENAINAADYKETIKVFFDASYADFEKNDAETILSEKLKAAFELIYEAAPDRKCLDFLIVKNDFHNIKAVLKGIVTGTDVSQLLLSPSVVEKDILVRSLTQKEYDLLPENIGAAVIKAFDILARTMDGQLTEVYLDKACLEASLSMAKETSDSFVIELCEKMTALTNVKIALRALNTAKDLEFMLNAFAECKYFSVKELAEAALNGKESLVRLVSRAGFDGVAKAMVKSYAAFEKEIDGVLLDSVKNAKYMCLGISPLVAYYFACDSEIKTVRIILSCKKNGIDNDAIRERVRELYV